MVHSLKLLILCSFDHSDISLSRKCNSTKAENWLFFEDLTVHHISFQSTQQNVLSFQTSRRSIGHLHGSRNIHHPATSDSPQNSDTLEPNITNEIFIWFSNGLLSELIPL